RYDQRIYEAGPLQLLEAISEIEDHTSAVLMVGHNPGMEELLQLLTDRVEQMAPGTLAKINLAADEWSKIKEDNANLCSLDWIVKPKELAVG
ncbi:MAG: SixA phosphatase family protein, partial [Pyrinomonadaceae bacterium]